MEDLLSEVSVVMPVFNGADHLRESIESVLAQGPIKEILVIDDASSDASADIAREFGGVVRVESLTTNGGVGNARQVGLRLASGTYIACCDADDLQPPYRLAAQATLMERRPELALVVGDGDKFGAVDEPASLMRSRIFGGEDCEAAKSELASFFPVTTTCREEGLPVPERYRENRIFLGRAPRAHIRFPVPLGMALMSMFRRSAALEVGGYDPGARVCEDVQLSGELVKRHPFAFVDVPLVRYRVHENQLTTDIPRLARAGQQQYRRVWVEDQAAYAEHRQLINSVLERFQRALESLPPSS